MKLLHFADIHIGMENYSKLDPKTGLSTRLQDFLQTFDFIVDKAIEEGCDALVFAGDAYKTRDPNPTQQRGFGERIKRAAHKMPVVLVVGNHDTPNAEGRANTLDIYSALEIDNVYVSRTPELLNIPTKSGNLQIITLPWLHKNDYKTVGDKLLGLYEKIDPTSPAIFLSHAEIEGASYGSEKGMAIANDVTIPLSLLQDRRLSYVALGHIHKHQVLSKDPPIVYAGSPHRIDFGEEKEDKGVILVEIESSNSVILGNRHQAVTPESSTRKDSGQARMTRFKTTYQFIDTNARKFLTITITLSPDDKDPTLRVLEEIKKHNFKEKIIRLIINIPANCDGELQMDKIKKSFSDAHLIAGISRNVERKERTRLDITEEVERLTPIEALRKYFESKKTPPEKQKTLEKYATELLDNQKTDYY